MEDLKTSEVWRLFRIQAELIDGIETLNDLGPAVSLFGSARLSKDSTYYQAAQQVVASLSKAVFSVITGGVGQTLCMLPMRVRLAMTHAP